VSAYALTRFTDHSVAPDMHTLRAWLVTTQSSPPLFTGQMNPNLCANHGDPTPNICFAQDKLILITNELIYPSADVGSLMKRVTTPVSDLLNGENAKPAGKRAKLGHCRDPHRKASPSSTFISPEAFFTMTPTFPHAAGSAPTICFFSWCSLLFGLAMGNVLWYPSAWLISNVLWLFGHLLVLQHRKILCCKQCRVLLLVFLTVFPAPGAATAQGLANHHNSFIQIAVHTNTNASTSMVAVAPVTSWAQLVTECAASSANITLSPTFQMGAYSNQIDFSGKVITIFGSNAILDAGLKGIFFNGDGSIGKTSLELHDITLKNGKLDNGGAIYANGADVEIHNSFFLTNRASANGGAIYIEDGTLVIHSTTFDTNTAAVSGGAIYTDGYNGAVKIEIYNSTFRSNTANNEKAGFYAPGGAIRADVANVEIHDSTFQANTASGGSAIFINAADVALVNCTFASNVAADGGGAVWVDGSNTNATFVGCTFLGNNNTKGNNDVTRKDDTSNVTFACANGSTGASVTMKAGESEITNPPPMLLKCTIGNCFCIDSKCVVDPTSPLPCSKCQTPGFCV
jgi:predicted outer membrane repeat protein